MQKLERVKTSLTLNDSVCHWIGALISPVSFNLLRNK